jgi:DNA-binding NarL/FixJ family response regulator
VHEAGRTLPLPVPVGLATPLPFQSRRSTARMGVEAGGAARSDLRDGAAGRLLSERELDIVGLIGQGCTNREIASRLCLSAKTVDNHVQRILGKVGAGSRTVLAVWAYRLGRSTDVSGPMPA